MVTDFWKVHSWGQIFMFLCNLFFPSRSPLFLVFPFLYFFQDKWDTKSLLESSVCSICNLHRWHFQTGEQCFRMYKALTGSLFNNNSVHPWRRKVFALFAAHYDADHQRLIYRREIKATNYLLQTSSLKPSSRWSFSVGSPYIYTVFPFNFSFLLIFFPLLF